MSNTESRYFTFGSDHTLPDGREAKNLHVRVDAPRGTDHRAVFMGWLGSNKFSSEYDNTDIEVLAKVVSTTTCAYVISVERACPSCWFPISDCHCLADALDEPALDGEGDDLDVE